MRRGACRARSAKPARARRGGPQSASRRATLGCGAAPHRRARAESRVHLVRSGNPRARSPAAQRELRSGRRASIRSVPADGARRDRGCAGSGMKYHVALRNRTHVIDVEGGAVTVDGERFEAHWDVVPGTPLAHLLLGRDSWTVACQSLGENLWAVGAAGERSAVQVQDDRAKQIEALTVRDKQPPQG